MRAMETASEQERIADKIALGKRITSSDAAALFNINDLVFLGRLANAARNSIHNNSRIVTYIIDRNINYTNVCDAYCDFCAFYRPPKHAEGYILSREELARKIEELKEAGGNQVLLQGGHNPYLKIEWYEDLFKWLKRTFAVHIHGLSAPEVVHLARVSKLAISETLTRLKNAGLDSLPGGGAEILTDRCRNALARNRASADEWIEVHRTWHRMGMKSTCTMTIGHIETIEERIEHLERLRNLQDETGGFTAFIVWTMQTNNTKLRNIPTLGSYEYLKTLAISRLYLDNIKHFQSSWVTQGMGVGQLALKFGCDDMGSTMLEENVVSSAGTTYRTTEDEIRRLIEQAGYTPKRRNFFYELLES